MRSRLRSRAVLLGLLLLAAPVLALAQAKFNGFDAPKDQPPPRDLPLVEEAFKPEWKYQISLEGKQALAIDPDKWRHAETDHFIVHFRRMTEATKVIHQVEYDLWFVAKTLHCGPERYGGKSHVYIFADTAEWKKFLTATSSPPWFASFAYGSELFLNVRGNDTGQLFDAVTLAHETTHAVVARLYLGQRWPLWLSEGFAETMGEASVSARTGTTLKSRLSTAPIEPLPLDPLVALSAYPANEMEVLQLYKSAEKLVRYLYVKLPPELLPQFIGAVLAGDSLETAIPKVYGQRIKNFDAFQRSYQLFR